jgi:hypothetical protein
MAVEGGGFGNYNLWSIRKHPFHNLVICQGDRKTKIRRTKRDSITVFNQGQYSSTISPIQLPHRVVQGCGGGLPTTSPSFINQVVPTGIWASVLWRCLPSLMFMSPTWTTKARRIVREHMGVIPIGFLTPSPTQCGRPSQLRGSRRSGRRRWVLGSPLQPPA